MTNEIARIEAQRTALEVRLTAFEAFVDKLKRAKDRVTFDRFMAEHHDGVEGAIDVTDAVDHQDYRPNGCPRARPRQCAGCARACAMVQPSA